MVIQKKKKKQGKTIQLLSTMGKIISYNVKVFT